MVLSQFGYYVYVLRSQELEKLYVGYTKNLNNRLIEHKQKKTRTTAKANDWKLIYYEVCINQQDAINREKQFKTGFGRAYLKRRLENYLNNMTG